MRTGRLLLGLALLGLCLGAGAVTDLDDDYDDDPPTSVGQPVKDLKPKPSTPASSDGKLPEDKGQLYYRKPFKVADYPFEVATFMALVLYVVAMISGAQANKRIAVGFAQATCFGKGVLDSDFSFIGPGGDSPGKITKESASCYVLYASGRRFCQSLEATLDLIKRQDLIYRCCQVFAPQDDELQVVVEMNEAAMPPVVLAVATTKLARQLVKNDTELPELAGLTRRVDVAKDRLPGWPADRLQVLAEQASVFYDLFPPALADQMFSKGAYEDAGRWFRSLIFTSERRAEKGSSAKVHPCILRFSFALPPDEESMNRLLAFVMACIDQLGSYKMGPEQRKKAEKARQDWAVERAKGESKDQDDKLEARRTQKAEQEQEKLRKMTPEARAKYQERKQKIEKQRMMQRFIKKK